MEKVNETQNTTQEKKDKIYISFSNKQIFNRRTIESEGEKVNLVSVGLPSASKYKGYCIDVNADYVYPSKWNKNNMSCTSYLAGHNVTIRKYDKETDTNDKIKISAEELKEEFLSWQKKDKDKNENAEQKILEEETEKQSDMTAVFKPFGFEILEEETEEQYDDIDL